MLVIVSWVSFWLDPNAIPARVSLGVTTLLTMATQISGINASLPPVSYTKAIDVWTGVCLTFVFGALLEFALVNYASRADAHRAAFKKKQDQSQMQGGDKSGHDATFNQSNMENAASFSFASNQINSNSAGGGQGINFQSNPTAMVQNQGWDLETNFDFDHLIEPSSAGHTYGMVSCLLPFFFFFFLFFHSALSSLVTLASLSTSLWLASDFQRINGVINVLIDHSSIPVTASDLKCVQFVALALFSPLLFTSSSLSLSLTILFLV